MLKKSKMQLIGLLVVLSLGISFVAGYFTGRTTNEPTFTSVEQAGNIILSEYVYKDNINIEILSQAAIKGMVTALGDPNSGFVDPETYQRIIAESAGKAYGIGAEIEIKNGNLTITDIYEDLPADKAGLKAGDVILKIDDMPTSEMDLPGVVQKITGLEGTSVRLLILPKDENEPEEITVLREEIKVPSVNFEIIRGIAYIKISGFTDRTYEELSPVLEAIINSGIKGIVLDLRDNTGGLLNIAINVTGGFVDEGEVVRIADSDGNVTVYVVSQQELTSNLPMVVLVNNNSASASEVVAGALQSHERAIIAGTKTYGKGSANVLYQLVDGPGLRITVSQWFTPDGNSIEGVGVSPDVELEVTGEDAIEWAIDYLLSNI